MRAWHLAPGVFAVLAARWFLAAGSTSGPAPTGERPDPADSWARYRILAERNVFLRDRYRPPVRRLFSSSRPAPVNPNRYIVLTGVVSHEDGSVAFFENTQTGEVVRVRLGERVAAFTVRTIRLDEVQLARDGQDRRVEVGSSLTGESASWASGPTTVASTPPAGTATSRPTTTAPIDGGGQSVTDILERLRRRREEQLRQ